MKTTIWRLHSWLKLELYNFPTKLNISQNLKVQQHCRINLGTEAWKGGGCLDCSQIANSPGYKDTPLCNFLFENDSVTDHCKALNSKAFFFFLIPVSGLLKHNTFCKSHVQSPKFVQTVILENSIYILCRSPKKHWTLRFKLTHLRMVRSLSRFEKT